MIKLDVFESPQEANIVKGMLENNGIPAFVQDDNNLYVPVFNSVSIYVNERDLKKAHQLLKSHRD